MNTKLFSCLSFVTFTFECLYALPDAFYLFDDLDHPSIAKDSGTEGVYLSIVDDSIISGKNPRFGEGSLLIQNGTRSATAGWYSRLSNEPIFRGGTDKLTILAWVSLIDHRPLNIIIRSNFDQAKEGELLFRITAQQRIFLSVDGFQALSEVLSISDFGDWAHVGVTFREGEVFFYLNGDFIGSAFIGTDQLSETYSEGSFSLGLHSSEGVQFDEVAFVGSEALDQDSIRKIYQLGLRDYLSSRGQSE